MSRWERFEYTAKLRVPHHLMPARLKDYILQTYDSRFHNFYQLDLTRDLAISRSVAATTVEMSAVSPTPSIQHRLRPAQDSLDWDAAQDLLILITGYPRPTNR